MRPEEEQDADGGDPLQQVLDVAEAGDSAGTGRATSRGQDQSVDRVEGERQVDEGDDHRPVEGVVMPVVQATFPGGAAHMGQAMRHQVDDHVKCHRHEAEERKELAAPVVMIGGG
jgi:hypothetical protein